MVIYCLPSQPVSYQLPVTIPGLPNLTVGYHLFHTGYRMGYHAGLPWSPYRSVYQIYQIYQNRTSRFT